MNPSLLVGVDGVELRLPRLLAGLLVGEHVGALGGESVLAGQDGGLLDERVEVVLAHPAGHLLVGADEALREEVVHLLVGDRLLLRHGLAHPHHELFLLHLHLVGGGGSVGIVG